MAQVQQVQLSEQDITLILEAIGSDASVVAIRVREKLLKMRDELRAKDAAKEPTR